MRRILFFLPVLLLLLAACSGSKNSTRSDEKDLASLMKRLNKKGPSPALMADLQEVYTGALQKGTTRIGNYQYEPAPGKWDGMLREMDALQRMYETISLNAYALRQLKPVNYSQQIRSTRDTAAADYYTYGQQYFRNYKNRQDLKEAYYSFDKAASYVPNYKDTRQLMQEAWELAIVHVLINRIQYDDFGVNTWNMGFYNNQDLQLQDRIIFDLGGRSNKSIPARFYNEYDLQRERRAPDYVTDLVWRNLRFDQPIDRQRQYQRSKQIETGKDTAGKPVYQTVYATVYITQRELTATGEMNVIITEVATRNQLAWDRLPANYRFNYEFARYTGDQRALDNNDWSIINNNRNQQLPRREEVMSEMVRDIYQNLLGRIRNAVDW